MKESEIKKINPLGTSEPKGEDIDVCDVLTNASAWDIGSGRLEIWDNVREMELHNGHNHRYFWCWQDGKETQGVIGRIKKE